MRRLVLTLVTLLLSLVIAAEGQERGISGSDLAAVLTQLPPGAPIVYFSRAPRLLPTVDVVVVATGSYSPEPNRIRSAKVYLFLKSDDSWIEAFSTDEDQRLEENQAPASWEISFDRIEYADVDDDRLSEVVIYWNSASTAAFSLIQYDRILNVVDYDVAAGAFAEITRDRIVFNDYMDDAFFMNVDSDPLIELVLWRHAKLGESIMSPRPYRLSVWEVQAGQLAPDPAWNHGVPLETEEELDLSGCGRVTLMRLLLQNVTCSSEAGPG